MLFRSTASRKGRIDLFAAKEYKTLLMSLNQEYMLVMLLVAGKWGILSRYFLHGFTL